MKKYLLAVIFFLCITPSAYPEGYAVNLQSTRQIGMGNIGTGLIFGASSMYYNPGALAMMGQRYSFLGGVSLVTSHTDFTSTTPGIANAETANPAGLPFFIYTAYKPENSNFAFGLAVYTPFGNSVNWQPDWGGEVLVDRVKLETIFIQPTVSYQFWDKVGVGIGLILASGSVHFQRALPTFVTPPPTDGTTELEGETFNVGINVGIRIQPIDEIAIGFSFRSKMEADIDEDGDVYFYGVPNVPLPPTGIPINQIPPFTDNSFSASLPLPAQLNWGIAIYPTDRLLFGFDLNWVLWNSYQQLVFTFQPSGTQQVSVREWKNSFTYRFGGQYTASEALQVRAGFYYDQTPVNTEFYSPETPGSNRWGFSIGSSIFVTDHAAIDLALLYINGRSTSGSSVLNAPLFPVLPPELNGDYESHAWIPSVGISYNLNRIKR